MTLPELLVVLLVVGALTALALPRLVDQRAKADDAGAKALAAAGAAAMQEHATLEDDYAVSREELLRLAPELRDAAAWTLAADVDGFELRVSSRSGSVFAVGRRNREPLERHCRPRGVGGCGRDGDW